MASASRLVSYSFVVAGFAAALALAGSASAAQPPVGLGTATSFAVLAGTTVTNTGPTTVHGDLGVSPGTAITGFPPGTVSNGTIHASDAVAANAQADVVTAYNDAAGRGPAANVTADLGGQHLVAGVYSGTALSLTGTLTLDAQGDPGGVFVFQSQGTLITASSSVISLINGANACNVFWQVQSSATLGTNSTMLGTVMALTSVTANTGATVTGRLLARNAAVTLDSNTVQVPSCSSVQPSPSTSAGSSPTATPSVSASPSVTGSASPSSGASAAPSETPSSTLDVTAPGIGDGSGVGQTVSDGTARGGTSLPVTGRDLSDVLFIALCAFFVGGMLLALSLGVPRGRRSR